jgi:tRNA nucleotidyltransferase/poly(A) polymerase
VLQKLKEETKAEVYFVGGYVRDLLRNIENKDIDIVVKNYPMNDLIEFLNKWGKTKLVDLAKTSDDFRVSVLLFRGSDNVEAQISLPRRGKKQIADPNNTLKQDVKHRDFTINGLYLPVDYKSKNDVIDHVGGRFNMHHRLIFAIGNPEERIKESPIRILRAISLSARTGYQIDNSFVQQMFNYKHLLLKVPMESVREELNKVLLSRRPSKYFKLMSKLGILQLFIPELEACRGIKQDKRYHKWDVFEHCIYTCDFIEPTIPLRLAALLHDIGKPPSMDRINGKITFHKHEMLSVKLSKDILERLRYDNNTRKEVLQLIRLHMYHYTREFSDSAVRRFIIRAGITAENIDKLDEFPLFKLRAAERLGNGLKNVPITEKQKDFQNRIEEVFGRSKGLKIEDLEIKGDDIMSTFNMKQSPKIGDILRFLLDKIIANPELNNKKELFKLATEYMCDENLI